MLANKLLFCAYRPALWQRGPMDEGVSWYSTGVDFASPQENIVAALALVYHATSTGGEELLKKHMAEIIAGSEDYTPDGSTERHIGPVQRQD